MPNTDVEPNENLEQNGYLNSDSLNNNHITESKNGYCDPRETSKAAELSEPIRHPVNLSDNLSGSLPGNLPGNQSISQSVSQSVSQSENKNRAQSSSPTVEFPNSARESPNSAREFQNNPRESPNSARESQNNPGKFQNNSSPAVHRHPNHRSVVERYANDWPATGTASGPELNAKVNQPPTNHQPVHHSLTSVRHHHHLKSNSLPTKEAINGEPVYPQINPLINSLKNHSNKTANKPEEDDDNNSVFLSPEKSRLTSSQSASGYLASSYLPEPTSYSNKSNSLVYKSKCKKKSPKSKKQQQIISLNSLNSPQLLRQFNDQNPNLNGHLNRIGSSAAYNPAYGSPGPFILTESHFALMEESSDDEKQQHENEMLYNDLNRITINAHENRLNYQYLHHQHFHHHHPNNADERQLIAPTHIVQPTNTTAALFALQQRKQAQQAQLQQRKEQNAKYIKTRSTVDALNGLMFVLSAIYAKLIVILGLCFPMAEVISHRIPIRWYEGFYLYLYLGSIFFLVTIYIFREKSKHKPTAFSKVKRLLFWSHVEPEKGKPANGLIHENSFASNYTLAASGNVSVHSSCSESDSFLDHSGKAHYGSFYLRLGAVAFGIGSMIYSGLEFGLVFELENKEQCYSFLLMMLPSSHVCFTFFQLYFIFMNSKALIVRHRYFARFGLMHMIATNLCVWLHVLIQETKHQITILMHPNKHHEAQLDNLTATSSVLSPLPTFASLLAPLADALNAETVPLSSNLTVPLIGQPDSVAHKLMKRSIEDHEIFTTHGVCRRSNVIGQLVMDASQFLFPCTIEYSLICAAILYIMWKSTDFSSAHGRPGSSNEHRLRHRSAASSSTVNYQHPKHYYQVDCAKSVKGLFCGIFLLVVCIISLILFFVLIKKPNYKNLGIFQAHVVEIILYVINAIACVIAIIQIKELPYNRERNVELDNILLIVAQFGLYLFNGFSLIGAHFYNDAAKVSNSNTQLVKIGAIVCLIQATLQTVFILDATKRTALTTDQVRRKPGREMVTFLLVCNFSMWSINTLETRRSESTPVQLNFYGPLCWTVFTHITAPLTIFFRFHSTVCLCDIWKKFSKLKSEY